MAKANWYVLLRLKRNLHFNNRRKRAQLQIGKIQYTLILRMPSRCSLLQITVDEVIGSSL